jgi:5-methylcytosine-specific restriction enzyme subunit McrC
MTLQLQEWETLTPDKDERLKGSSLDSEETRKLSVMLARKSMLEVVELATGLSVRAFSYVGDITLGDIRINIRPKIEGNTLLNLFRYAYGLKDLHLFRLSDYDIADLMFQDLIINQLVGETRGIISRGLVRQYVRTPEDLSTLAGRIDFQRMAKRQGSASAVLPCIHHPRLADNLINQVLLAGLHLSIQLTTDIEIRGRLHRLAGPLEENVSVIKLDRQTFVRLNRKMSRLNAAYRPALSLIRILYEFGGILGNKEERIRLPGFLFDMNRFFQALLSRFLGDNLSGYRFADEHSLKDMMAYLPGKNPRNRRSPQPRPDFAVFDGTTLVALLDAKYRDLWQNSLPREMLYQLAIYAMSQSGNRVASILYPVVDPQAEEAVVSIREPVRGASNAQVVLRPVNLLHLEQLVRRTSSVSVQRDRKNFANWLVWGSQ